MHDHTKVKEEDLNSSMRTRDNKIGLNIMPSSSDVVVR